jgi:hypothetical protein
VHGHRRAVGECLDGSRQAATGRERRVDAVRRVPQLIDRRAGVLERFVDELPKLRRGVAETVRQLQGDDGLDEPLLRTVVEVTDNALSLLIRRGDDPGAGRDQLGETREPVLGADGRGSLSSVPAISASHTLPSIATGAPTSERIPSRLSSAASSPDTPS